MMKFAKKKNLFIQKHRT